MEKKSYMYFYLVTLKSQTLLMQIQDYHLKKVTFPTFLKYIFTSELSMPRILLLRDHYISFPICCSNFSHFFNINLLSSFIGNPPIFYFANDHYPSLINPPLVIEKPQHMAINLLYQIIFAMCILIKQCVVQKHISFWHFSSHS
jgi:hypothetical protein